jgi:hypothetical protein
MWLTLKEAKESALADVASACPDSALFVSYVNQAARQLLHRGSWESSVQKLRICSYTGCIVWPRWVEVPLAMMTCNRPFPIKGNWFEFMPVDGGELRGGNWNFGPNYLGGTGTPYGPYGVRAVAGVNETYTPVFREIVGQSQYLRAYITRSADIGKTMTIFGIDDNGQEIRTTHPDGNYREGVVVTFANPFAGPSFKIREITRVLKDKTAGIVSLFQYDADGDQLIDCAIYQPSETNPQYVKTVTNPGLYLNRRNSDGERCATPFTALVKIKFIPAESDDDIIIVSNLDALKLMIMSIKRGDAGDIDGKRAFEADAVRELNLQLRNSQPLDQIPVSINPFGTALPNNRWNQRQIF